MGRLCERPGCSEAAALAYGLRTEDLVFWIDALNDATSSAGGVLCQRHGDSMVVPRGWTLDDLRDPELHLFRPPDRPAETRTGRRRLVRTDDDTQQLEFGGLAHAIPEQDADPEAVSARQRSAEVEPAETIRTDETEDAAHELDVLDESDEQWTPAFDDGDDLDGLLAARSPLLSRAFRGADRPG